MQKKKAQYQNYISDICLVLNIHDQLAALKVSLKDSLLLSQPHTDMHTHITRTMALSIVSLHFYHLLNIQRKSGRLVSISL